MGEAERHLIRETLLHHDVLSVLAADMGGGRVAANRSLLDAYRRGFTAALGS